MSRRFARHRRRGFPTRAVALRVTCLDRGVGALPPRPEFPLRLDGLHPEIAASRRGGAPLPLSRRVLHHGWLYVVSAWVCVAAGAHEVRSVARTLASLRFGQARDGGRLRCWAK